MKSRLAIIWPVLGLIAAPILCQPPESSPPAEAPVPDPAAEPGSSKPIEVVRARMVDGSGKPSGPPGHRHVLEVRRLKEHAGRLDWNRQGTWIAFDKRQTDERYDIFLMQPDGGSETCLTCDEYTFRFVHTLSPTWHPSGEFLVFTAQRSPRKLRMDTVKLATPHRGLHSELWSMSRDGKQFGQITIIGEHGGALIDPAFSFEGDKIVWSERLQSTKDTGPWGAWGMRLAEVKIRRGILRLGKVQTFWPGTQKDLLWAHGFTPDDLGILVSGRPYGGKGADGVGDLYVFKPGDESLSRLTSSLLERDGIASYAPKGDRIVWATSRGIGRPEELPWRQDLWVMSTDGRSKERLTFFNDLDSAHFLGEALINDLAWGPKGERLALHVVSVRPGSGLKAREDIYLLVLDETFRR